MPPARRARPGEADGAAAPSAACAEVITGVARALEDRLDLVTDAVIERLEQQMPELAGDEAFREQTSVTARASLELITAMAATWTDPHELQAPREALLWARSAAHLGISSEALLRAYRLGHARYWELWFDELLAREPSPELLAEVTRFSSAFFFRWIDAITRPLLRAYEEERDRRERGAEAVRGDTVRALLAGEALDDDDAARRLRYELRGWHIGFIVWIERSADAPAETLLEDVATRVARVVGGARTQPLIVRDGALAVWAWLRSYDAFPGEAVRDPLLSALDLQGASVALGEPGAGAAGFRTSHEQARVTRRIQRLTPAPAAVAAYDPGIGALSLLLADPEQAAEFVTRTLGPLAAQDDGTRRLLGTLRVFQEEGQSFARTATRLGVHQNTVAYRVRRALELAGTEDAASLGLRAAVALAPMLEHGAPGAA